MTPQPTYEALENRIRHLEQALVNQKKADRRLRRYEHIISSTNALMSFIDRDYVYQAVNDAYLMAHARRREDIVGHSIAELLGEKTFTQVVKDHLDRALDGDTVQYQSWFDYPGIGRRYMDVIYRPYVVDRGTIDGVVVSVHDLTERKLAEERLRDSEEKFRDLVENINEVIFSVDATGRVTYISPRIESWGNFEARAFIGQPFSQFIHADDQTAIRLKFQERLSGMLEPSEYRITSPTGETVWVRSSSRPFYRDGQVAGIKGVLTNITETKELEAQLVQAQKMEAIGTLSGGIAHDFNNLLMGIQGHVSLMMVHMDKRHPHFEKLQSIVQSVQSGTALTRQLLEFARGNKAKKTTTDLNGIVNETARMFGRTRKDITIRYQLAKDLWTAEVDQQQIAQVLLNLYVNAWQAMMDGGKITIQSRNVVLQEAFARKYGVTPGNHVQISVADTGIGMDKATQAQIFDPFFTTKEIGQGTGLGLASVYGIIQNHNGVITVTSKVGRGATFDIYLPASDKTATQPPDAEEQIVTGNETILLVDDEQMIIEVGKNMLTQLGYAVMTAESGREALRIYRQNIGRIHLVILDVIMPDMNGWATFDALRRIDPAVNVLLASGHCVNEKAAQMIANGCREIIYKPFTIGKLSKTVRAILDAA